MLKYPFAMLKSRLSEIISYSQNAVHGELIHKENIQMNVRFPPFKICIMHTSRASKLNGK